MKIKVPTPRQLFLLLIILMLIFCTFLSVAYWFYNPHKTDSNWAVEQLSTPDRKDLQKRINSQLFADDSLDSTLGASDLDSGRLCYGCAIRGTDQKCHHPGVA